MKLDIDFSKEQEKILEKLVGILGSDIPDVLKTIFVMWLTQGEVGKALLFKKLGLK